MDDHIPYFQPTDQCHHYESISEVPWDIQKYWHQRYSIFSKYDEGIYMTDDAWFGVTPEPVANRIAKDMASSTSATRKIVVDIFAGAGGNAIAFALSGRWERVIAIEKDSSVMACAQHNAEIYGVSSKIEWIHDDSFIYLPTINLDPSSTIIFASPPWGGVSYGSQDVFDLDKMLPYSLEAIHRLCRSMDCAFYLPRTSDLRQIAKMINRGQRIEVVQYCMEGASKALVAYLPASLVT